MKEIYTKKGEWSSLTVKRSARGWLVRTETQICGNYTGRVILVLWSGLPHVPPAASLYSRYNDYMDLGQYIAEVAGQVSGRRVIRCGVIVR